MSKSKVLELSIKIGGRLDASLGNAINGAEGRLGVLSKTIGNIGKAGLAAFGTLGAVSAGVISTCTERAADFQNELSSVIRYVDGLNEAIRDVNGNVIGVEVDKEKLGVISSYIQDLSTMAPRTTGQISAMSAALGQSGKGYEEQVQTGILRDTVVAATAMDLDDETAGNYMAKWENAFNLDHNGVMDTMDIINYMGANYATTAAEIAESLNRTGSLGQIAGADLPTSIALATAMQASGVEAERVGTSIQRIYTNISKGTNATKAQKDMFRELGFTAEGIAKSMQMDGTGTLLSVFEAIGNLAPERQVAALNTLFGAWALEGGAKVAQNNVELLKSTLAAVQSDDWHGSMEREFLIQADSPEAVDMMTANAKIALMQSTGEAFLPAKKQLSLAMLDMYNSLRKDMPQLGILAENFGGVMADGVTKLANAFDMALPYISKTLDYLNNHGDEAADVLLKTAGVFAAMSAAPTVFSLAGGAKNLLFGSDGVNIHRKEKKGFLGSLWNSGFSFADNAAAVLSAGIDAVEMGEGGKASSMGNFLAGTFAAAQNLGGLNSKSINKRDATFGRMNRITSSVRENGVLGAVGSWAANTAPGRYFGGIGSAFGKTKTGGFIGGLLGGAKAGIVGAKNSVVGDLSDSLLGIAAGKIFNASKTISGGIGGAAGKIAASPVLGVISAVSSPVVGMFGHLLTGALPVVGVVSAIIAGVSLLGDKLGFVDGIVQKTFGDEGLAKFNTLKEKVGEVREKVLGLFYGSGTINALMPLEEIAANKFGEGAGSAFHRVAEIAQSAMGVGGKLIDFSVGTVKPMISGVFGYLGENVMPKVFNLITVSAPYVAKGIDLIGNGVMKAAQLTAGAIQFAAPYVGGVIDGVLTVAQVVLPAALAAGNVFFGGVMTICENGYRVFNGVIDFVGGVFSDGWERAWTGVVDIFGGTFGMLEGFVKTPLNAVITLVNGVVDRINQLNLEIPDWVPGLGGKNFAINLPQLPMLANGGFTSGVSIAGEAGREAVISFRSSARQRNLDIWERAGRMLGVKPYEFADLQPVFSGGASGGSFVFSPQITINGNADRSVIDQALREAEARFKKWYEEMVKNRKRTEY